MQFCYSVIIICFWGFNGICFPTHLLGYGGQGWGNQGGYGGYGYDQGGYGGTQFLRCLLLVFGLIFMLYSKINILESLILAVLRDSLNKLKYLKSFVQLMFLSVL
jgi:hypothetical protein